MAFFGRSSMENLESCDHRIQAVLIDVITITDFKVISGYRSSAEQDRLFDLGRSKKRGGHSVHNVMPSRGVDIVPYPVDWKDLWRFYYLAGVVMAVADKQGVKLRWGGDWDGDGDFLDQSFNDLGHFELVD